MTKRDSRNKIEKMNDDLEKLLNDCVSVPQAAGILGVDRRHIWHLIEGNKIAARKIGGTWIVYAPSLNEYSRTKSRRGWKAGVTRRAK